MNKLIEENKETIIKCKQLNRGVSYVLLICDEKLNPTDQELELWKFAYDNAENWKIVTQRLNAV